MAIQATGTAPGADAYAGRKLHKRICLGCGSPSLKKLGPGEYVCECCGSRYETDERDVVQKSVVTDKELMDVFFRAAECDKKDDFAGELRILLELEEKAGDNDVYLVKLGRAFRRCDMKSKALSCYKRAAEINPENASIYVNIGTIYLLNGKYQAAADSYKIGIEKMSANPMEHSNNDIGVALANYGAALAALGYKKEGESYIKKGESYGYPNGKELRKRFGIKTGWFG